MSTEALLSALLSSSNGGFALIGAWARNAWAPPRATTDLDLVVRADLDTLRMLTEALERRRYHAVRSQRVDSADDLPDIEIFRTADEDLRQVDLLLAKTDFEAQALARAVLVDISGLKVPVVTPEDLVVYKLLAHRTRDRDDVRAVIRTQMRTTRPFDWNHVERWSAFWGIEERARELRTEMESP
jgi:predicted nucleotidyltransferase